MQKATSNIKILYTYIFEYAGTLLVGQFYVYRHDNANSILHKWIKMAMYKKIIPAEEGKRFLLGEEWLGEPYKLMKSQDTCNVWWTCFSPNGDLTLVKTSNLRERGSCCEKEMGKCNFYQDRFNHLKKNRIITKETIKERRKCERLLNYWCYKKLKKMENLGYKVAPYTVVMEYKGNIFTHQFYIACNHKLNSLLILWSRRLKAEQKALKKQEDYEIILQKVQDELYQLIPISEVTNVWSTYFTLSRGLGNVFVIKTEPN